jgi:hypothetical protein
LPSAGIRDILGETANAWCAWRFPPRSRENHGGDELPPYRLTVTYGVRYYNNSVPYETNGVQAGAPPAVSISTRRTRRIYQTNHLSPAIAIPKPGVAAIRRCKIQPERRNQLYANTNAVNSYNGQYLGLTRNSLHHTAVADNELDIAIAEAFFLRGHRLQFRAEAFHAFNNVNFYDASLGLDPGATFGDFQRAMPPRVMHFALRYEF